MKLNRKMIHLRIGLRNFEHLRVIQAFKSKTATAIIEDALEKGLAWYLKQISGELGRTKENPLTWDALASMVKLSDNHQKDDKPEDQERQESQEPENMTDAELEYEFWMMFPDEAPDFPTWLKKRFDNKMINQEQLTNDMQEYLQEPKKFEKPTKTKI